LWGSLRIQKLGKRPYQLRIFIYDIAVVQLMCKKYISFRSICLPMEAESTGAIVYLSFLLLFNGLAFLLVATAYLQMYRAVAGHGGGAGGGAAAPGASSADTAIAKKMALLVFTDFACWAPVAFFGLTAVGGYPLIGNIFGTLSYIKLTVKSTFSLHVSIINRNAFVCVCLCRCD